MIYKLLWNFSKKTDMSSNTAREKLFVALCTVLFALLGLIVWFFLHFFICNSIYWLLCFIGYPAFFAGFVGGIFYTWKMEE